MTPRIELVPLDIEGAIEHVDDWPHLARVVASNGKCLCETDIYSTRTNARRGAQALCRAFGAGLPIVTVRNG